MSDGYLCGFKWFGADGETLLTFGLIDNADSRNDPENVIEVLRLGKN